MTSDSKSLRDQVRALLPGDLSRRLGVAVSGGGDSVALLDLLAGIAATEGVSLFVATVDHGLRPDSADEAAGVADLARRLNLPHETLRWEGWDGSGNLQDQARRARYRLLTEWAERNGVEAIALGHTADDQAETVLMRLARAAGVNGLAGMPAQRIENGILLLRPLLGITRARLREHLRERDLSWVEDPSNQDLRYDRIKARDALAHLEPLGITTNTLVRVAQNMAQARDALDRYTQETARTLVRIDAGDVLLDRNGFLALPDEISRRLLVGIVGWIGGAGYPPRSSAVQQAVKAVQDNAPAVLGGCLLLPSGGVVRFCREYNAVRDVTAMPGEAWDRRWVVKGPEIQGLSVRALGEEGLRQLPDWRVTGRPRAALAGTPAVWKGDELLAAPVAGFAAEWSADLVAGSEEFFTSLLSH
ncbi:tRNA lysidine(34) synthetase TilS [Ruegeria marisrubri]|uniref:tRNA lysidine(34) synthetase TilS n=1 Tax=Ruegeria marisrubri TaxID=1685379 RepID=UPI000A6662AA|nr:tRNA lysidine(34) synthetase TilS [Ruegeria marisrubri]